MNKLEKLNNLLHEHRTEMMIESDFPSMYYYLRLDFKPIGGISHIVYKRADNSLNIVINDAINFLENFDKYHDSENCDDCEPQETKQRREQAQNYLKKINMYE